MKRILTFLFALVATVTSVYAAPVGYAKVSVVHNSPSPFFDSVDVYINGVRPAAMKNLHYRDVSSFVDSLPADVKVQLALAHGNSNSIADTFGSVTLDSLKAGKSYIITASGLDVPANYHVNPNGISTGFGLYIFEGAYSGSSGQGTGTASFVVFHGVTDAPYIDVVVRGVGTVVNNLGYGQYTTGYLTVPASDYIIDVYDSGQTTLLKSFYANLSTAAIIPGGASAFVFASGFADTTGQGPEFNLFAGIAGFATSPGIPFRIIKTAKAQVVHNAADPAADTVDVYVKTTPDKAYIATLHNVAFRTATAYLNLPSNVPLQVVFKGKNSTAASAGIDSFQLGSLLTDSVYEVIADGNVGTTGFAANPDGASTAFGVFSKGHLVKTGNPSNVDLLVFHGATDAPTVNVQVHGTQTRLINHISYGNYQGYLNVPAGSYTIDVTDSSGSTVIATYVADVSTLGGKAVVLFASGYVTPSGNNNGPAFHVWAALEDGTTFALPVYTGINEKELDKSINLFPNPATTNVTMLFNLEKSSDATYRVVNSLGQTVDAADLGTLSAGTNNLNINTSKLTPGMYFVNLVVANNASVTRSFMVK